jgi:DNA end-binding protein Ku
MARQSTARKSTKKKSTAVKKSSSARKSTRKRTRWKNDSGTREQGPGRRPLWSGTLRLALVSVAVKLYAATDSGARISFHQVHEPSGKRIRYQKIVPDIGPVDTDEIVKGFELESGRYVLLDPEEINALKLEAKHTLDLVQFEKQGEIPPIWFDRPYYVVPDGDDAEEAYGVLRDALRSTGRLGLGQFVMRGREYIAALKPCGNGLMLETLRFADEVREAAPYFADFDAEEPKKELLELAEELIERKAGAFKPQDFKDSYTEALRDLVDAKAKHSKPVAVSEDKQESGKVIDLVEALKRSVDGKKGGRSSGKSSGSRRKAS